MNIAFSRLHWSIFEDVSGVQVMDDPKSPNPNLSPFWGHAIATEAATNVPLTEIEFTSDDPDNYFEYDYTAPDAVLVERADGGIVTISDVVERLGVYFLIHKKAILLAKAQVANGDPCTTVVPVGGDKDDQETLPANTRVFFDGFFTAADPRNPWFIVILWVEGENGHSIEDHWRQRV